MTDILKLDAGKKTPNLWTAAAEFFPLLRRTGHQGIVVSGFCADRGIFSALDTKLRQRVEAFYHPEMGPDLGPAREDLALKDWWVSTGCALHDIQNALCWSLSGCSSVQDHKDMFVIMESLRNAYTLLVERLPAFLDFNLHFRDQDTDFTQASTFWRVLGVAEESIAEFAAIDPQWEDGKLFVNSRVTDDPEGINSVTHLFMKAATWRKFTKSRWLSLGHAARSLTMCLPLGLEMWVSQVRHDPTATDYYLHGFGRMTSHIKFIMTLAALVTYVPETGLVHIMQDDRLARCHLQVKQEMEEKVQMLENLPDYVWTRLAANLGPMVSGEDLYDQVLASVHLSMAYTHDRVFSQLREYPWRLLDGEIDANLVALEAST